MSELEEIKKLIENGFATRDIAIKIGKSYVDTKTIVKNNNFSIKYEDFSEDKIDGIIDLYRDGVSAKNLGIKFNIGKKKVQAWAQKEGILRDKNSSHRLHFFDEHIFDQIDTEEKAYWLGFLYADAYNCEEYGSFSLRLKSNDIDHIKKFCKFLSYDPKLITTRTTHDEERKTEHNNSGVCINSVYFCEKLTNLGCMQAKSFKIQYPDWLDKKLDFHFIRGVFDGDGCIKKNEKSLEHRWNIVGTIELCAIINKKFRLYNLPLTINYISETGNNTYEVIVSGNLKVHKVCELLYNNATIYLDRKFERFEFLKELNMKRHPKLFSNQKYDNPIIINNCGPDLTMDKEYLSKLSIEDRKKIIEPIVNRIMEIGFIYPDNIENLNNELDSIKNTNIDITNTILDNHSRIGNYICKYFCGSYFKSKTRDKPSIVEVFSDKQLLTKLVENKLGLHGSKAEELNFSCKSIISGMKKGWISSQISIFKPVIAKYICLRYSEPNDVVGDYSAGFGGRLLGAMSCGRKYIGTDPLTADELNEMISFFDFNDCKVIQTGSEYYKGEENSIDLYWSSPPYFDQEVYSNALSQAYSKGEDYFYNVYWRKTLENVKYMLKKDKWFGVNISEKYGKIITISEEYFGDVQEKITLKSKRDHMLKSDKQEYIYMFKNNK
jgi:hypothetical protein